MKSSLTRPTLAHPDRSERLPLSAFARRYPFWLIGGLVAILVLLVLYIGLGTVALTPGEVLSALWGQPVEAFHRQIVWDLRFPRGLVAILVGAMLGLAGAILQSITRNPLASPDLTGVSAGSVFAAVLWLTFGPKGQQSGIVLPLVALVGGAAVGITVYLLSRQGRSDSLRLALNGILLGAVLSSATSMLLLFAGERAGNILLWLIGSLNGRTWIHFETLWPFAMVALPLGLATAGLANALHLGDEVALGLGQRVEWARVGLFGVAVLLTAAAVSIVGAIGFIGLIGPHICRRLVGDDSRRLFPLSAVFTALLLLASDFVVQAITKGQLPVGAITALLGGPFFLYLIFKRL
jgi:iron complex transport system permease protein